MRYPFFFVALSILLFTSCKEPVISGIDLDAQIHLIVKDTLGLNLLDPSTPNHYNPDDIRLYYLVDGQKVEQYYPNLSSPRHFAVMRNESIDEYFIRIFLHDGTLNQEVTTTYIQWRKGDEDTIRS
ncbi:hypothetical protein [Telluribacter humicola]|uniref:hypothetical protein n=1 Tax=Telluribacter humicola TaxID=1720261 RepID=UPI001A96F62F|nr:hypothetical protein [Telluribacter humicola]